MIPLTPATARQRAFLFNSTLDEASHLGECPPDFRTNSRATEDCWQNGLIKCKWLESTRLNHLPIAPDFARWTAPDREWNAIKQLPHATFTGEDFRRATNAMRKENFTGATFEIQEDPRYLQNCCNRLTWENSAMPTPAKFHTYLRAAGVPSSFAGGLAEAIVQQDRDEFTEVVLPSLRMQEDRTVFETFEFEGVMPINSVGWLMHVRVHQAEITLGRPVREANTVSKKEYLRSVTFEPSAAWGRITDEVAEQLSPYREGAESVNRPAHYIALNAETARHRPLMPPNDGRPHRDKSDRLRQPLFDPARDEDEAWLWENTDLSAEMYVRVRFSGNMVMAYDEQNHTIGGQRYHHRAVLLHPEAEIVPVALLVRLPHLKDSVRSQCKHYRISVEHALASHALNPPNYNSWSILNKRVRYTSARIKLLADARDILIGQGYVPRLAPCYADPEERQQARSRALELPRCIIDLRSEMRHEYPTFCSGSSQCMQELVMKHHSGTVMPPELGEILRRHLAEHIEMLDQFARQREILADARRRDDEARAAAQQRAARQAEQEAADQASAHQLAVLAALDAEKSEEEDDSSAVKTEDKVDYDAATEEGAAPAVTPGATSAFYTASATPKRQKTASAATRAQLPATAEDDAMESEEEAPPLEGPAAFSSVNTD